MKATWNGATIAESDDTVVVEGNHYFPEASLKREYVDLQQPPLELPVEGPGALLQPDGRRRAERERGLVLPGAERGGQGDQGPRRVLEGRQGLLIAPRRAVRQRPALKFVKMRVCTRRIACGTASGGVMPRLVGVAQEDRLVRRRRPS